MKCECEAQKGVGMDGLGVFQESIARGKIEERPRVGPVSVRAGTLLTCRECRNLIFPCGCCQEAMIRVPREAGKVFACCWNCQFNEIVDVEMRNRLGLHPENVEVLDDDEVFWIQSCRNQKAHFAELKRSWLQLGKALRESKELETEKEVRFMRIRSQLNRYCDPEQRKRDEDNRSQQPWKKVRCEFISENLDHTKTAEFDFIRKMLDETSKDRTKFSRILKQRLLPLFGPVEHQNSTSRILTKFTTSKAAVEEFENRSSQLHLLNLMFQTQQLLFKLYVDLANDFDPDGNLNAKILFWRACFIELHKLECELI